MARSAKAVLKIELPMKLLNQVEQVLVGKQLSVNDAVRLYLRAMVTASERGKALKLDSVMPFGKFKDETLEVVVRAEPKYILWLIDKSTTVKFDPEVLELLEKLMEEPDDN